jgi:hypothetical protein
MGFLSSVLVVQSVVKNPDKVPAFAIAILPPKNNRSAKNGNGWSAEPNSESTPGIFGSGLL